MNPDIIKLQQEIEILRQEIDSLKTASAIPLSIERAFGARGFLNTKNPSVAPLGAEVAGMGFIAEIGLTGNPETITVVAPATKFLEVKNINIGGTSFYIPIYFL